MFQSTHPHGVRHAPNVTIRAFACFNPRTHTGCDVVSCFLGGANWVSIHAPTRGATYCLCRSGKSNRKFQSTHPHGVRHNVTVKLPFKQLGFNPRTHTGCDTKRLYRVNLGRMVSIHAPTRGATYREIAYALNRGFNPRTHTGCDNTVTGQPLQIIGFNPRTHTGCDPPKKHETTLSPGFNPRTHTGCDVAKRILQIYIHVSIHAPTRGATAPYISKCRFDIWFQSTHPHGVRRQIQNQHGNVIAGFNPRTHTGCDNPPAFAILG